MIELDPLLVWMAAAALATLFAHAALDKARDLALTEQHVAAYGVPFQISAAFARALPAVEALAALLLMTPWRAAGAVLAAALLLAYAAAMAWHRLHGRSLDCGCGGEPLPVSWALVVRNGLLAALAGVAGAAMAPRAMGLGDFFVVVAALLMATLLYAALHQVLRHRAGLQARTAFHRS
ncbi:Methylamine utilization protein MauE [Burkholderiales bacterium JOSHI_001]|nr:Methylamine utilization protein MauE [Burkholderiales bacterium JOSHI_001]